MRWRSSLSSIMTSMASNGGFDEQGAGNGEGGAGGGSGTVDMDVGDGKTGPGGERKVTTKPSKYIQGLPHASDRKIYVCAAVLSCIHERFTCTSLLFHVNVEFRCIFRFLGECGLVSQARPKTPLPNDT